MSKRLRINSPKIIYEKFDDEVIIVNLENGSYYSVDQSGARIWMLLAGGFGREEILAHIGAEYAGNNLEIEQATSSFLDDLNRESLFIVEPSDGEAPPPPAIVVDPSPRPFVSPKLQKYTDMEELLVLDPIHEVDEVGWPRKKEA
jgi:coenzyme PQQ synthesis protein D (PqqD)